MKRLKHLFSLLALLFAMQTYSQHLPPGIEWQKSLGGSGDDRAKAIIRTADNGYLVVGYSRSNDGDVSGHHGALTTSDGWVVKLSAQGGIEWQRSLGGSQNDEFISVLIAEDGNYLLAGQTSSNDGDVSGNHGSADVWIVKLSRSGTIIWQQCYGGPGGEQVSSLRRIGNDYYFIGTTNADGGQVTGFRGGISDIWVGKINTGGTLLWQRCFGGTQRDVGYDIAGSGNSLLMAVYYPSQGGDFGSWGSASQQQGIVKVDSNYSMLWKWTYPYGTPETMFRYSDNRVFIGMWETYCSPANPFSGTRVNYMEDPSTVVPSPVFTVGTLGGANCTTIGNPVYSSIITGANSIGPISGDQVVVAGHTNDVNMPGYHTGPLDGMVAGMKAGSGLLWKRAIGGSGTDRLYAAVAISEYQQLVAGYSNSNNGDVSGNHGDFDFWVVKLGNVNFVKGTVFIDDNRNGIKDANEPPANNVLVETSKGTLKVGTLSHNGNFTNRVDTGNYSTKATSNNAYYSIAPASINSIFTSYFNTDSFSFALQPIPGKRDYKLKMYSVGGARPGFNTGLTIQFENVGTDTLTNKEVKLIKDSKLSFISASLAPTSVSGDTIKWNIASLKPRESNSIQVTLKVAAPPAVNNGDNLVSKAIIDSTGDLTPLNNLATVTQRVTGSFDPNDKNESLGGKLAVTDVASKDLVYTIRFQNTGNDTAFTVVIRDTLDAKLDWSSIEMLSASHAYSLEIKEGNQLAWTFDKILLPDSNRNEPASHGYITYSIRPKATLIVGDVISNSASIYFDFNLPVKTNVHETVVVPSLLVAPNVSGVRGSYCSNEGLQSGKINNLPANGSGITVTVKLDGNSLSVAADSTFTFNVTALAAGSHVIEVSYANGSDTKTTTINFTITAAVTPDVNVSANNTTAVNLIDPVIITAANAAGGGNSPLYTFGKDRNFTTLWQAEGSNNVLNINPTSLQNGDNWIYVRMKTSSTCFTVQSNIDSIKITLQLPVPNQPVITGINANYCVNEGLQKAKITNYPAPGTGSTITAKIDGSAVAIALADTSFSFNVTTLGAGNHVAEVTFTNLSGTKTTTINFTVTALVTPDVNVTANIRNVSSLAEPIVITASNATGGGQTPAYTFAKNRTFTDIIQAEGIAATVTLTPTTLKLGENWIYVRMKTSSNCYTQQTAIDSIKITRFGSRGLIDPDYPDQVITSNPNPFRNQINVYGLSANKSYTIMLYNQQGKVVQTARVNGRTIAIMRVPGHAAGSYMLSIYDQTKNKLIGTINLVKQ